MIHSQLVAALEETKGEFWVLTDDLNDLLAWATWLEGKYLQGGNQLRAPGHNNRRSSYIGEKQ